MNATHEFDVLIAGAGPAGTCAALAMQGAGLRIALIDRTDFPRDKTCGDALAAYIPKVLRTIDKNLADEFVRLSDKQPVNVCRIISQGGYRADLKFQEEGAIMKREAFDFFLWKKATEIKGLSFFPHKKITAVNASLHGAEITCEDGDLFRGKILLACDGANGPSARMLTGRKMDKHHHSAAVRAYFKGVSGMRPDVFELHFLRDLNPGYFWIFPLPDGEANVGLGMPSDLIADRSINLKEEFEKCMRTDKKLAERFAGAAMLGEVEGMGLPLGSRQVSISGDAFILCGDAASLIDPLSGEGIGQAVVSGRYGGWQVKACFKNNRFDAAFMKSYDESVYKKIWSDHRRRYRLRMIMQRMPWLFDLAVRSGVWRWIRF